AAAPLATPAEYQVRPRDLASRDLHLLAAGQAQPARLLRPLPPHPEQLALEPAGTPREGRLATDRHLPPGEALEIGAPHQRPFDARRGDLQHVGGWEARVRFDLRFERPAHPGTVVDRNPRCFLRTGGPVDTQPQYRPRARTRRLQLDQLEA